MQRRILTFLSALAMLAGLAVTAPTAAMAADAQPTWRLYNPHTFTIPANWACGRTANDHLVSTQSCVIRQGKTVQAVLIVRNRASIPVPVEASTSIRGGTPANPTNFVLGDVCAPSRMAARGLSACFSRTRNVAQKVYTSGSVYWNRGGSVRPNAGAYFSPIR